ncbi:aspartyl/asparaginyl beta-hydroxylase domain-containing protein [Thalassomonas actiniarum]|uniref:Aspartyl/asparaginyl beta-hydroxylase domain-containing protein n=1 Tax=Thalassomonas actiniarum TaxID=485447 RepID=A0AAF0C2I1_9GAMM|nr:aspartyl/asparaginyl beta-hydroxylase domain-containing protein [Thalassomonas actiniarum]WDD98527.1 aspartyl/asparaginyl beta-hydroxylase domain-containing protein [Thalassomonas actiniarum]
MSAEIAFAKLAAAFDINNLNRELTSLSDGGWIEHVNKRDYQGGWDVLPLRCPRQYADQHAILQSFAIEAGDDWVNLPVLARCPEISKVLDYFHCPLKAVRLMRLNPGAYIQPHRDMGLAMEYGEARIHLPICGADQVTFLVDGQVAPMAAGELWYLNADLEHSVRNNGSEARVNLVIDCKVNAWLQAAIENNR